MSDEDKGKAPEIINIIMNEPLPKWDFEFYRREQSAGGFRSERLKAKHRAKKKNRRKGG